VLKKAFAELTLGQRTLRIWVFVAEITDQFILGLDVLRAYNASVDVGLCLLRLGQKVTLWKTGVQQKSSRLSLVNEAVIAARCERVLIAKLEAPLGTTNILIEPSQESYREEVFVGRALVRAGPRVPVRIMNVTNQQQVLNKGTTIGHGSRPFGPQLSYDREPEPPKAGTLQTV
jgi:hypothetical protein